MHIRPQLQAQHVALIERPFGREPHRAGCDAASAVPGAHPVADLGHAVDVVLPTDAARAHDVTRGGVDDGERPQAAVLPAAAARSDIRTCVGARVRSGNVVDPMRDLRITAGFRDHRHVAVRPGPQQDDTVGQGRVGSAQPQRSSVAR